MIKKQQQPGFTGDTREKLLLTAERLYATEGISAVSLRRINREAGQANASALHYHFGSRDELIEAILHRRREIINARRLEIMEQLRDEGRMRDVSALCSALVRPLADEVADSNASSHFVGFVAAIYTSPEINVDALATDTEKQSLRDLLAMFKEALPDIPLPVLRVRFALVLRSVINALADWQNNRHVSRLQPDMLFEEFVAILGDTVRGALSVSHNNGPL